MTSNIPLYSLIDLHKNPKLLRK